MTRMRCRLGDWPHSRPEGRFVAPVTVPLEAAPGVAQLEQPGAAGQLLNRDQRVRVAADETRATNLAAESGRRSTTVMQTTIITHTDCFRMRLSECNATTTEFNAKTKTEIVSGCH